VKSIQRGEVHWVKLDPARGSEMAKRRPCVILSPREINDHRRTVVVLISDGLDTGDAIQLSQELQWLKRHSRHLLWLNPLLRFDGYAPLATGANLLHRHADGMLAIHNLNKLEELANAMAKLLKI
jgi:uncharacterized protein with von Willebrand factor type A (vWA) domain